jgi:TRAP-type mannitol/chloroaromatic compound transport system permease small subunit
VFYASASPRAKALVDLWGALLLLLPFALAIIWFSWPYVARSWAIMERSRETSGLPLVFLLKTLIPVFGVLLALQGLSQGIKALAMLTMLRIGRRRAAKAAAKAAG